MKQCDDYQQHLDRVSRSFAFCIKELSSPYRDWVGLSYILCRIVDTIEDSTWGDKSAQISAFLQFIDFIQQPVDEPTLAKWLASFPYAGIPDSEQQLLADAALFFNDLHALPAAIKTPMQTTILNMTHGMMHFCQQQKNHHFRLHSIESTNQYCFFVAGVVGELLTHLFSQAVADFSFDQTNLLNGFHFGLFLQKVNILKDQAGDEAEGRFFISDRQALVDSVAHHAGFALDYIQSLPSHDAREFRLFCAWSLYVGLASLPYIEKSHQQQKPYKLPRLETLLLLSKVKKHISDDVQLTHLFQHYLPNHTKKRPASSPIATTLPKALCCYQGELQASAFNHLQLLPKSVECA